ncbi:MAG: DUF4864 domain-containing protein [Roseovarius sp.]
MRHILSALLLALVFAMPAKADETAIRSVISDQIEAFQADDFAKAFTYASPKIQGLFGNAENFGTMVRQGYPMVWRPAEVQFLGTEMEGGRLWQNVMIRDATGRVHVLGYEMITGENGWKINAVKVQKVPEGMV